MVNKILFLIRYRPRLFLAMLLACLFLSFSQKSVDGGGYAHLLLAWNIFAFSYLALALQMIIFSDFEKIKIRAVVQSESNIVTMMLVIVAVLTCIGSIILELSYVRELGAQEKLSHLILPALTILSSWFFTHLMFGLQYAHDFYKNQSLRLDPGLLFPGNESPDYWDFIYAAFIIGTSAQTADVSFTTRHSRRVALIHSVTSFFFNTTILALTINIAASVI